MYLHSRFKQLQTFKITNLDKRGSPKEETKHVGHDVITDHTRNGHNEPDHTKNSLGVWIFALRCKITEF